MVTKIVEPVLQRFPGYVLKPVTYLFGNSKVEIDGPAEGVAAVREALEEALGANGFDAHPLSSSGSVIGAERARAGALICYGLRHGGVLSSIDRRRVCGLPEQDQYSTDSSVIDPLDGSVISGISKRLAAQLRHNHWTSD